MVAPEPWGGVWVPVSLVSGLCEGHPGGGCRFWGGSEVRFGPGFPGSSSPANLQNSGDAFSQESILLPPAQPATPLRSFLTCHSPARSQSAPRGWASREKGRLLPACLLMCVLTREGRACRCERANHEPPAPRDWRGGLSSALFLKMAAAKDGCGLGKVAVGNGRRLHLGIPEAVFVVRDMLVLGILTLCRDPSFLAHTHTLVSTVGGKS